MILPSIATRNQHIADVKFRNKSELWVCSVIRKSMTNTTGLPNLQGLHFFHELALCTLQVHQISGRLVELNFQTVYLKQRNWCRGVTMNRDVLLMNLYFFVAQYRITN